MAQHHRQVAVMKLLFFTPTVLPSAIGRVSNLVILALQQLGHEVVVVRTEDDAFLENVTHPFSCPMIPWTDSKQLRQLQAQSDLVVYQIGNHYPYHRGCLEWLPSVPGLVLMHDYFLGHLFWAWSERVGRPRAQAILSALYSSTVANEFFDHTDSASFVAYASEAAPMTEWMVLMASGVVVHSSWAMNRITRLCSGPVEVVPLPYDAPHLQTNERKPQLSGDERIVALTIGNVNHNKRYTSVIQAIGASPVLRERLTYRIVGAIEPAMADDLKSLANRLKVNIVVTGVVDDQCLAEEIRTADIMCCLRQPALEAASASTIEAMLYSKPTIVTDTGFYRDLPDNCVFKIPTETELADLRATLEKLVASPTDRAAIGNQARQYAITTFRADNYAIRIVNMKHRIDRLGVLSNTAGGFSATLKRWGVQGDSAVMTPITAPLALFR
jgi:glycosyltransferase involved in cell wall biosynthesis